MGSLKPNDLGLFDMMGNAMEWCQEEIWDYPSGLPLSEDKEHIGDIKSINVRNARVLRGGSFLNLSMSLRSANRTKYGPANRLYIFGVRPARTLR